MDQHLPSPNSKKKNNTYNKYSINQIWLSGQQTSVSGGHSTQYYSGAPTATYEKQVGLSKYGEKSNRIIIIHIKKEHACSLNTAESYDQKIRIISKDTVIQEIKLQ